MKKNAAASSVLKVYMLFDDHHKYQIDTISLFQKKIKKMTPSPLCYMDYHSQCQRQRSLHNRSPVAKAAAGRPAAVTSSHDAVTDQRHISPQHFASRCVQMQFLQTGGQ